VLVLEISLDDFLLDDENVNTFFNVSTLITEYVKSRALPCGWQKDALPSGN